MARRRKPLSPEALHKRRSAAAKKGWRTRRARQIPEKISKAHKRLGESLKKERETRKAASNSRITSADSKADKARIKLLERAARQSEKERKRLESEIARLRKNADKAVLLGILARNPNIDKNQAQTIVMAHAREGWVDTMPEKWIYREGGMALNPCRLRHTDQFNRWQEKFRAAERQDGGEIGGPSVKQVVKEIHAEYHDFGYDTYFPDEEPLDEHEIWTLYFSP